MDIGALIPITVVLIVCSMISWLIWLITRTRHLQIKAQAELHHRLLEKFGSTQELIDFLQSEGGQQFLDAISAKPINPKEQILSSVQKGIILTILGIGGFFLGWIYHYGQDAFTIVGVLVIALGVGFLASAGISYRLSQAWGLLTPEGGKWNNHG